MNVITMHSRLNLNNFSHKRFWNLELSRNFCSVLYLVSFQFHISEKVGWSNYGRRPVVLPHKYTSFSFLYSGQILFSGGCSKCPFRNYSGGNAQLFLCIIVSHCMTCTWCSCIALMTLRSGVSTTWSVRAFYVACNAFCEFLNMKIYIF